MHTTMRTLILGAFMSLAPGLHAQTNSTADPVMDTAAILIMDRMADMIGSLHSCSFDLHVSQDLQDPDHGMITRFTDHQVFMTGPDRMHVNSIGERAHKGYWYNGWQVAYYNFTENNFGFMEAPANIIAMIDEVHHDYGVDFPAADFFYPTFTDDLIAQSTRIDYLGTVQRDGRECFRIVATGKAQTVQLWIANDATFLPVHFIITDHAAGNTQYEGAFTHWVLNPDIPDQLYEFMPPPGAARVTVMPRKSK
jgi:hypothetical protein